MHLKPVTLKPALAFLIMILTAIALVGCGGSGGSSSGSGSGFSFHATQITAQVTLPSGAAGGPVNTLSIWTSLGQTNPDPTGAAAVSIYNGGPQYTDARDAQGHMVLAGFLGQSRTELNADSTAELLAFFSLGGAGQIDTGGLTYLQGIKTVAGFSDLVAAVTEQLTTLGYIDVTQSNITAALQTMADALRGPKTRGTIADPTSDSGVSLDTQIDGQLKITNVYLRRLVGFLQRTGYRNTNNVFTPAPGPVTQINIDPPKRFSGFFGTITDLARGDLAYSPVVTGPFDIPFEGPAGTEATVYELRVGGLGALFHHASLLTGDELQEHRKLVAKTILLDGIFPFILKICLPIEDNAMGALEEFCGNSAAFAELLNAVLQTAPQVYDLASQGRNEDALIAVYESIVGSGPMMTTLTTFITTFGEHINAERFFKEGGSVAEGVTERLGQIGIADIIGSSADLLVFLHDVAVSEQQFPFEILSTGGKATLTAERQKVPALQSTTLTAIIQNKNPDAVYRYEWSVSQGYELTNSSGSTSTSEGGILVSSSEFAAIVSNEGTPGKATVTCNVVRIDGALDKPVDRPHLDIEFVPTPTVTPNPVSVEIGQVKTITGSYTGNDHVYWKFILPTTPIGTIDRTNIGDNPVVHFTADDTETGNVTMVAECYLDAGGHQLLDRINVPITVSNGDVSSVQAHIITDVFLDDTEPLLGDRWFGVAVLYVHVPVDPTARFYELYENGNLMTRWAAGTMPATNDRYLMTSELGTLAAVYQRKGLDINQDVYRAHGGSPSLSGRRTQGEATADATTWAGFLATQYGSLTFTVKIIR